MESRCTLSPRGGLNFDETPFLAIWEITQSCDLACKHCRPPPTHPPPRRADQRRSQGG